ncbi:MAG: DUF4340 domain-containing protein [Desulfobacteraceae bacterium]|nr:DUF4340 domain-containing protein [Desulfobacteraceae bacterium]PLX54233.1 MAG: hypothetical protein C0611_01090 [Desulfobacteraceae bacterium]
MKLKKEYVILAAILVALILYLALHRSNRTHYQLPELSEVSGKHISKLEITTAGNSIIFNQKDNTWNIEPKGYRADPTKVKNILNVIEKLKLTALVSESKNYVRYDLRNDKNIHVKAWQGETLLREFDIGKAAPTFKHTFVKLPDDPNVYHARGDFRRNFDRSVDDFRDKTVLSFAQNTIQGIELTLEKKTISLSRKEIPETFPEKKDDPAAKAAKELKTKTVWEDTKGHEVAPSKISSLLSFLNSLECERYLDDLKKEDLKNPIYTVALNGEKEYSLLVFSKKDNNAKNYSAISSENESPFSLSDTQMDTIKSKLGEILNLN